MRIDRLEIVRVADLHGSAVVKVPTLMVDHAVGRGIDRLADLALIVDAVVETTAARAAVVETWAEWRGDSRIWLGLGERTAAQPPALIVEPAVGLVRGREPPEQLLAPGFADTGGEDPRCVVLRLAFKDVDLGVIGREA